jgi:phytanoyl-CoA hydroxylase
MQGETPMRTIDGLTPDEKAQVDELGHVMLRGFADPAVGERMLSRVVEVARAKAAGTPEAAGLADAPVAGFVLPEANLAGEAGDPEDLVAKVFGLHRDTVFHEFVSSAPLTDVFAELIGPAVDCFLSQFIFKNPGAWGQPWHQDSYYFDFDPPRPVYGGSLAITESVPENGGLHVIPRSHREPVHPHVPDRRPGANYGYVEVAGRDMSDAEPLSMGPGDMLVFDSHLIHRSGDNTTGRRRAAMTFHFAATGTTDLAHGIVNDFVTVRSGG